MKKTTSWGNNRDLETISHLSLRWEISADQPFPLLPRLFIAAIIEVVWMKVWCETHWHGIITSTNCLSIVLGRKELILSNFSDTFSTTELVGSLNHILYVRTRETCCWYLWKLTIKKKTVSKLLISPLRNEKEPPKHTLATHHGLVITSAYFISGFSLNELRKLPALQKWNTFMGPSFCSKTKLNEQEIKRRHTPWSEGSSGVVFNASWCARVQFPWTSQGVCSTLWNDFFCPMSITVSTGMYASCFRISVMQTRVVLMILCPWNELKLPLHVLFACPLSNKLNKEVK